MKLSELITKVGDENVKVQFLASSLSNIRTRKGGVSEVSFLTTEMTPTDVVMPSRMVGMIVWVPRDKWDSATADIKPEPQPKEAAHE